MKREVNERAFSFIPINERGGKPRRTGMTGYKISPHRDHPISNPARLDAPTQIINELGLENVMFEAADPQVFAWYVKNYGCQVNLFIDHSQIVQLDQAGRGIGEEGE